MSWVSTKELFRGRGGSQKDDGKGDSRRVFRVVMDSPYDTETEVALQYGGPKLFDPHNTRPAMWCNDVDIRNSDDSAFLWIVTAAYSRQISDPEQVKDNPLDEPPLDSWKHSRYSKPAVEWYLIDSNGVEAVELSAITNSAGDAFDPPDEMDATRMLIHVTLNMAAPPPYILDYQDCINNAPVVIRGITFATHTLKINTDVSEIKVKNGITYRQIDYDIETRWETWNAQLLDRGYNTRTSGKPKKITVNGSEPSDPVLLDGNGQALGIIQDADIAASATTLNGPSATFRSTDVGNAITVKGAGAAGADLITTIAAFISSTSVTLATAASTTVTVAQATWVATPQYRRGRKYRQADFSVLGLPST